MAEENWIDKVEREVCDQGEGALDIEYEIIEIAIVATLRGIFSDGGRQVATTTQRKAVSVPVSIKPGETLGDVVNPKIALACDLASATIQMDI